MNTLRFPAALATLLKWAYSLLVKEETVQNLSTTSPAKTFLATLLRRILRLRTHLVFTTALLLSDSGEVLYGADTIRVESLGKSECSSTISRGDLVVPFPLDIQIGVENGTSPFNNRNSITSLLQLNESFNGFQPTIVNPLVPYFFFLPETCANIAQHLPVKLQPDIGLYIRNTDDPQNQRVVQSPTYLTLVFQSTSGYLTIKIPFQLLSLTLEPSIVSSQQQCFPCQPFHASDGSGNYYLGRTFLQAAFLSINWDSGNFFLAQGPGPATAEANIKSIQPKDTNLSSDSISDFLTTWNKTWTPLASQSQSTNTDTSAKPPGNNTSKAFPSKRGGLSDRARAGIGVGVTVGVLALAAAAIATWPFH